MLCVNLISSITEVRFHRRKQEIYLNQWKNLSIVKSEYVINYVSTVIGGYYVALHHRQ